MSCETETGLRPTAVVMPGGLGDWAKKMVWPSWGEGFREAKFPEVDFLILQRTPMAREDAQRQVAEAIKKGLGGAISDSTVENLVRRVWYYAADATDRRSWTGWDGNPGLKSFAERNILRDKHQTLFQCLLPPDRVFPVVENAAHEGLLALPTKLMVEKPAFLGAAEGRRFMETFGGYLKPEDIYLVDHYIAKYSVLNAVQMIATNAGFLGQMSPRWLRRMWISSDEIDIVGEERVETYESMPLGVVSDMILTHLMQVALRLLTAVVHSERGTGEELSRAESERIQLELLDQIEIDPERCTFGQLESYPGSEGHPTLGVVPIRFRGGEFSGTEIFLRSLKGGAEKFTAIETESQVGENPPTHLDFVLVRQVGDQTENARVVQSWNFRIPGITCTLCQDRYELVAEKRGGELFRAYTKMIFSALSGDWANFPHPEVCIRVWDLFQPVMAGFDPSRVTDYPAGLTAKEILPRELLPDR